MNKKLLHLYRKNYKETVKTHSRQGWTRSPHLGHGLHWPLLALWNLTFVRNAGCVNFGTGGLGMLTRVSR